MYLNQPIRMSLQSLASRIHFAIHSLALPNLVLGTNSEALKGKYCSILEIFISGLTAK